MQMLKKLFNSDSKYYLELDELKESEVVQNAVKTAEKTAQVVKEKATEVAQSEPVKEAVKTASGVVDAAQDKVASAIATEEKPKQESEEAKPSQKEAVKAPSAKNGKVKGVKAKSDKADQPIAKDEEAQAAKTAVKDSGASSFDPPFWVAAMNNTNKPTNDNGVMAGETFAEDNLMPIVTKYRRRPGGSLDKFKDMAKSAKTPRR